MGQGWISLHRSIREHWIWEDAQKLKWWLDILLQANHQQKKIVIGNDLILVERGSFHTSIIKLSERWNIDRKTVKKFLNLLEKDSMISLKTSQIGTTLKITNYNAFQGFFEGDVPNDIPNGMDNSVDSTIPNGMDNGVPNSVDTNNNDNKENNDNNVKNEDKENKISPPLTEIENLFLDCLGEIKFNTWIKPNKLIETETGIVIQTQNEWSKEVLEKMLPNLELALKRKIEIVCEE